MNILKKIKNKKIVLSSLSALILLIVGGIIVFANNGDNTKSANTTQSKESTTKSENVSTAGDEETGNDEDIIWEEETSAENSSNDGSNTNSALPYLIKINRLLNCVTIYTQDSTGEYTIPVKAMVCSTGRDTPLGTYKTSDKYTWRKLVGGVWGQYAYRITGSILFHSVPYFSQNKGDLETLEYNKLGQAASLGCIRLQVADAKWLIENCPKGTTVVLYDDASSPGPLGKPSATVIPETVTWDPTDPDENNPWIKNITITGVTNKTFELGNANANLLENISAVDGTGTDITSLITVSGTVNTNAIGSYPVVYTASDIFGHTKSEQAVASVVDTVKPVIEIASSEITINGNDMEASQIANYIKGLVTVKDLSQTSIELSQNNFTLGEQVNVIVTARDSSNNLATKSILVKYSKPEIKWNMQDKIITSTNIEYLKSCVTVTYNNGLSEKNFSVEAQPIDSNTYRLVYTVTDSFNNTSVFIQVAKTN